MQTTTGKNLMQYSKKYTEKIIKLLQIHMSGWET